ncbi:MULTISPECIES: hypothetical protein [Sphingomonas]|nr:hypothetical protein [Sphingomonas sp. ABOLF]
MNNGDAVAEIAAASTYEAPLTTLRSDEQRSTPSRRRYPSV